MLADATKSLLKVYLHDVLLPLDLLLSAFDLFQVLFVVREFVHALPEDSGVGLHLVLALAVYLFRDEVNGVTAMLLAGADERVEVASHPVLERVFGHQLVPF